MIISRRLLPAAAAKVIKSERGTANELYLKGRK